MIQNEDYIEFDLKSLFFYILRHWKTVLISGFTIALLLGSFMAFSEYKTGQTIDMENDYWVEYQQYQEQVTFYEECVSTTQNKINALQDYISNSVLMKTDHRNVYIAKATYYVDSGYMILPENTFQNPDKNYTLSWYYRNYLTDYNVLEEISAEVGIETKYLLELIDVSIPNDFSISISVSHPSEQTACMIMKVIQEKLENVHQSLIETVSKHDFVIMTNTCGVYIDEELKTTQQEVYDELLELQDNLIDYKQDLYDLKQNSNPGELNVVTAFLKWFILGGFVGVILVVLCLFVQSLLKNRIHSSKQLISSYQTTVLGEVISSIPSLSSISKLINKLEGCLTENSEENLKFLAENIKTHCGSAQNIVICSDVNTHYSATIADALNKYLSEVHLLPVGDVLKEAKALRMLSECDAVVIITVQDQSKNSSIKKTMSLIDSYKKEIIGFIMAY